MTDKGTCTSKKIPGAFSAGELKSGKLSVLPPMPPRMAQQIQLLHPTFCYLLMVLKMLSLKSEPIADLAVLTLIPGEGVNPSNSKWDSTSQSLSLSPSYCSDMTNFRDEHNFNLPSQVRGENFN